ncbi:MAG: acetolactate synthase small subunit [bacterium]
MAHEIKRKHILSVLVRNRPGVLARVAGLFSRRGYNIESLAVGTTENPELSRMTIVVEGDDVILEQISKQLYKLIDVFKVFDFSEAESVDRELVLIKVASSKETRSEIMQIVDIFRARIVDVSENSITIEATGDDAKVVAIEQMVRKFGIKEVARTGVISLARGMEKE